MLGIGMQVSAQPSVITEVPVNSTGFVTIGDLVYFTAGDALWRTDGTAAGTIALKSGFAQPTSFTEFNGDLYFTNANRSELWRSDGTPSGTIRLHMSGGSQNLRMVGQINDDLFFQDYDAATGLELYRTDGTVSGTMIVKDINPGSGNGFAGHAAAAGNYLFFAANNGTEGRELWISDGSSAGTVMVEDINPGAADGFGNSVGVLADNNLYYFAGTAPESAGQPWVSDGTPEGTFQLQNIAEEEGVAPSISYRIAHEGVVYFEVWHWADSRTELWTSGGTPASTGKVKDIGYDEENHEFLVYEDKIYFFKAIEPYEYLWVTDGTAEGTQQIVAIAGDNSLDYFDVVNGHLLFSASDQGHSFRFYRSDGTQAGTTTFTTFKAATTFPPRRDITTVSDLTFYADHDGPVDEGYYPINEADYFHLIQTDGFTTQSMRTMFGVSTLGANDITDFNGKVIFTTYDDRSASGPKLLWMYDPNNIQEHHGSFTLVNADTDEDIRVLTDGEVITKSETENINIRFNPAEPPGSVRFTLNGSNVRTENAAPYSLAGDVSGDYAPWTGASPGAYTLTATPYSASGAGGTAGTPLTIHFSIEAECMATGTILREYWDNVSGNRVSDIPVDSPPTTIRNLTIFEGPTNSDTNYGARIRGYICPPVTGDYTFWIASNDHSELWLSPDDDPSKKKKIAYITGATNPREWDKFATQKSAPVNLTAGKRYYIEALHKQGVGTDNVAVGWQLPDGTMERPIPGDRLSPFRPGDRTMPTVKITTPTEGETFTAPADIRIEADAHDGDDGTITKVEFFAGPDDFSMVKISEDTSAPYAYTWENVDAGNYSLLAIATDAEGNSSWSQIVHITVNAGTGCLASGTITREYWSGVQGNRVSDIPVDQEPTSTNQLTIFEGPSNIGTNYATRIRGYICPPVSGGYNFVIASNDHSELWLSSDDNPANKTRIAYITGATAPHEWDKFSSQSSQTIFLEAGKRYYIEALHKQGVGTDHIAVGWTLPDGTMERPIPGNRLSPFEMDGSTMASDPSVAEQEALFSQISVYPNPAQSGDAQLSISGYEGIEQVVETQVEIINLTGEVVYDEKISCGGDCGSYLMNMNKQLVPGVYLINMKTEGLNVSRRLLVK